MEGARRGRAASALLVVLCAALGCVHGETERTQSRHVQSSPLARAIQQSRDRLLAQPWAQTSPEAERATIDFHSALVASAWRVAHDARYLGAPRFSSGRGVVGLPGLFNPDNLYASALLDPDGEYRISGVRGSHVHLTLQFIDTYPLIGLSRDLEVIDLDALGVEAGDAFSIELGDGANGIPMPTGARAVLARMTFGDWNETASTLRIDRLDAAPPIPHGPPHTTLAAEYLERVTSLWADRYLVGLRRLPVNVIPPVRASATQDGGLRGQQGAMARFKLAPDEGLLVTMTIADAAYQAIQVGNPWFATPNPVRFQSSLNTRQAAVDEDGKLRFVIAARDPGIANWLDTGGFDEGFLYVRWQGLRSPLRPEDQPVAERVRLADLESVLPTGTARVSAEERAADLGQRVALPMLKQ